MTCNTIELLLLLITPYPKLYVFNIIEICRLILDFNVDKLMASKTNKMDPIKEERAGKVREVGAQAIWSLSSCKPGRFEHLIKFIM